jgi:uncharacterized repeat protein (TIGR03803 family)
MEKVLYSFCKTQGCLDGKVPVGNLIAVKGTLYGATSGGGADYGTVFAFDPGTGIETVLYSFTPGTDGFNPVAGLTSVKGTLYGTTYLGGGCTSEKEGCGTVFAVDPETGAETVLHAFAGGTDGSYPFAGMIAVNGTLYGTTNEGGGTGCDGTGCGTVFALDLKSGSEKVLYSFCSQQNCADGASPEASLLDINGVLYGATEGGGTGACGTQGCGTVFSLNPETLAEKVLYSFCPQQNCTDGSNPEAGVIDANGMLYGTTELGGANRCRCGTIFVLDPDTGTETVLHSFAGHAD